MFCLYVGLAKTVCVGVCVTIVKERDDHFDDHRRRRLVRTLRKDLSIDMEGEGRGGDGEEVLLNVERTNSMNLTRDDDER